MKEMDELLTTLPQSGQLEWIGIRPARGEPMQALAQVMAAPGKGLDGDRFRGRPASKRQVTLIQAEHLDVMRSLLPGVNITAALLRRNLVISGINLLALKGQTFRVGAALLQGTSICAPCSKMELALGTGGYNAMRGHGGICARVIEEGLLQIGDPVTAVFDP